MGSNPLAEIAIRQKKKEVKKTLKKLFISQPMQGKTNEEIYKERNSAVEKASELLGEAVEVIDSLFKGAPVNAKPLWYLGKSIELLAEADVAYFASGWKEARGCVIEHDCAIAYGINTIVSVK